LLAREIGRSARGRGMSLHYPLVVAAGYSGLLIWHGGLSGSAPFVVATQGHFLQDKIGIIPITGTIGGSLNIAVSVLLLASVPVLYALLARGAPARAEGTAAGEQELPATDEDEFRADPAAAHRGYRSEAAGGAPGTPGESEEDESRGGDGEASGEDWRTAALEDAPAGRISWGQRLDRSTVLVVALVLMASVYLFIHYRELGLLRGLDLNVINFSFLFLGLLLHGSPVAYVRAVGDGVRGASGIILQFPFYAGIMGMMKESGLVTVISDWFVNLSKLASQAGVSPDASLPMMSFLSAGVVNLFVPSGGGQWAVQGPIAVEAAATLHVPVEKMVMAVAYGDEWTNMLQPFWALALLGITGLKARDIIGYTAVVMVLVAPLYLLALAVF
jgi:short-chain fatty acids transporter